MTLEDKVHAFRLLLFRRAEELGNVSRACRELGVSRSFYYALRGRFQRYGTDGLHPKRRRGRPGRPLVALTIPRSFGFQVKRRGSQRATRSTTAALARPPPSPWGPAGEERRRRDIREPRSAYCIGARKPAATYRAAVAGGIEEWNASLS